ncbi:SDR family oxidoreductase [Nocardioides oleivorans]|uniref:dTDP-4-dehydrorhamnose reductase n=1 Tax=Nocardioides oleivorans TaxID=273676 RepID=A0A4Q2S2I2_9ACTN|nr:SDR family oxidoreductase [Nocardioides oleivorans]RYB94303.1 SDR family oxidoreductase [Nocardioides oleivorans]
MTAASSATGGVLVLGASGMLGHALVHELPRHLDGVEVRGTVRSLDAVDETFRAQVEPRLVDGVDVLDQPSVAAVLAELRPDVVVNAVGVIKQAPGVDDTVLTTQINALLPHLLARDCSAVGARLVQISTDCVFSGRVGGYTEDDVPDPVDFYGRSKLLGEVAAPHVTLRTSIIGPELRHGGSLLEWFLSRDGEQVNGFSRAIYSGLPTVELARVMGSVVLPRPGLTGIWQVASQPISKYDLLRLVADEYGWTGTIEREDAFTLDRSLSASRFADETGYVAPSWPDLVHEMRIAHERWTGR